MVDDVIIDVIKDNREVHRGGRWRHDCRHYCLALESSSNRQSIPYVHQPPLCFTRAITGPGEQQQAQHDVCRAKVVDVQSQQVPQQQRHARGERHVSRSIGGHQRIADEHLCGCCESEVVTRPQGDVMANAS